MRQSRFAVRVSSLILAAACTFTGATTAQAAPQTVATGYAALGDSYSSGVGAGTYIASSGNCLRSNHAYPALWASTHAVSSFAFAACNGARTSDVMNRQLGSLTRRTGLVSLTVGGSDSGFSDVMMTCVLRGTTACVSANADARTYMDTTLPGDLDRLYAAISRRAPAARVVVLGYPHLYKLSGSCMAGLSDTARAAVNRSVDRLNTVIAKRVADHGFTYADVAGAFSGHEICSASPWLRSVSLLAVVESYHPTSTGQSHGYLPVFAKSA
ncbi:SGNH/GDSL hydrolase family protein [Streptomyces sp. NPDC093228]|uniref:SGNH/GDSL hydrolase family protein n=1 Tax=unclassified Streptomyces TaxID=2593676 RepID=UPI00074108AC|nr:MULTISPECIES: SGNH/GDSL hydrolase family protein [unclassified Streptomyces]KUJ42595.1 lipase [Streptomyces sp. NRRL F-5122]MDX3259789.1 SGNH/GDSL hydrolase family protein [Streptomyces sp. MI02-2A]REE65390.1 GDSL-like lipase/acylhydrolase family protein [Streptomyces sp. 3212.3]